MLTPAFLAQVQSAKTIHELTNLCGNNTDIAKFTIEGGHGILALTAIGYMPHAHGTPLKCVPTFEHFFRFKINSTGLEQLCPERLTRTERIELVRKLSPTFQKTWLARFFGVSAATIKNDL